MEYRGRYPIFDPNRIKTYPIRERANRFTVEKMVTLVDALSGSYAVSADTADQIRQVAEAIVAARKAGKPVILFTGAHLIKNGLSMLVIDLIERNLITLVAANGAAAIHDYELALIGQTSEDVPRALEEGRFGMAWECCYQNLALQLGNYYKLGYGESLGRMICDPVYQKEIFVLARRDDAVMEFEHPEVSVLAACYRKLIPFTVHAGVGTDILDQHPSFDGEAKGGCSGRDFLIYAEEVTRLTDGGVILNVGSAVTGPEVFLKAASMAGNVSKVPSGIVTADFDLRPFVPSAMKDESAAGYYFRDQKSVVTRVPQAYGGKGYYVQGDHKATLPLLYRSIIEHLNKNKKSKKK
jgi:hypothetical protein